MTNIIDQVIRTEPTRKLVRAIAPVLVYWAKTGQTKHTYGELAAAIGRPTFHRLGNPLGQFQNVIDALSALSKREIPTLNSLVRNKEKGIPSDGFSFVDQGYTQLDDAGKRVFVDGLNSRACAYKYWDWVLSQLELSPYVPFTEVEIANIMTSSCKYGGGEGVEHKALKDYIYDNPEAIGIKNVVNRQKEYSLPSGDKVDVYFWLSDGSHVAVEVKPSISNDDDIKRGIFQCVKYKAVMDAIQDIDIKDYTTKTLYITARPLSDLHTRLIAQLNINHQQIKI